MLLQPRWSPGGVFLAAAQRAGCRSRAIPDEGLQLLKPSDCFPQRPDVPPRASSCRFSDHLDGNGEAIFSHACALGLEGIISKRRDARYKSGGALLG